MNPQPPRNADDVYESIRAHLQRHLANAQPDFAEELHRNMSFDYLGLDSVSRVEMVSALAREWSVTLPPTAAYDFVTLGALADFVWSELSGAGEVPDVSVQ